MRKSWAANTLKEAIEQARYDAYDLRTEMETAFGGTPEGLQRSWIGLARENDAVDLSTAHDFLANCDVPAEAEGIQIQWLEMRPGKNGKIFRPARRDNIVNCLAICDLRLGEIDQTDRIARIREDLKVSISLLKGLSFPGMGTKRAA